MRNNWIVNGCPTVAAVCETPERASVDVVSGPMTMRLTLAQAGGLATTLRVVVEQAYLMQWFLDAQGVEDEYRPTENGGEPPGRAFLDNQSTPGPVTPSHFTGVVFWPFPMDRNPPRRLRLTPEEFAAKFEPVTNG